MVMLNLFPEFYNGLKDFSQIASTKLQTLNFSDPDYQIDLVQYFDHLYATADTLINISNKELNNEVLTHQKYFSCKANLSNDGQW